MRRRCWWWAWLLLAALPAGALTPPADAELTPFHGGAWRIAIRRERGPLAIYGFLWNRDQPGLRLAASAGGGQVYGLEPVSRQMRRLTVDPARPIAAVNGDFYIMRGAGAGATIGLFVRNGELLSLANQRPAFAVLADGTPVIADFATRITLSPAGGAPLVPNRLNNERGENSLVLYTPAWGPRTGTNDSGVEVVLRAPQPLRPNQSVPVTVVGAPVNGKGDTAIPADGLVLSAHGAAREAVLKLTDGQRFTLTTELTPALPVTEAVGGGPTLLRDGRLVYQAQANEPRHPRTAIGFDDRQVVALAIDGRRAGHSVGLTLPELAALMQEFGCREALNLDGGGSTTCWVRGRVLNRPSDGSERSVSNALALLTTVPVGPPARIELDPARQVKLTPGASFEVNAAVTDENYNPLEDQRVTFSVEGDVGRLQGRRFVAGETAGHGAVVATAGDVVARVPVVVLTELAELRVRPTGFSVSRDGGLQILVEGRDRQGDLVLVDPARLEWQLPDGWKRVAAGLFRPLADGARGLLRVTGFGASATVTAAAPVAEVIEDFEADAKIEFRSFPESVSGAVERVTGDAHSGTGFARLTYHLGTTPSTRAAYLAIDRPIGAAAALRAAVRGPGGGRVWLRAVVIDGNGERTTHTFHDGPLPEQWTTFQADLPEGLKPPLIWQSVYNVAINDRMPTDGAIDWDRLEVLRPAP